MLIAWLILTVSGQIFLSEEELNRGWHLFWRNRESCKSEMSNLFNGINRHLCISVSWSASHRVLLDLAQESQTKHNSNIYWLFGIPY